MGGGATGGRGEDAAGSMATRQDALHVIVLGSGGGPLESNTTSVLVRSVTSGWGRGSIVSIDAGVQLSGINRILEQTQPPGLGETEELSLPHTLTTGPFAGLEVPYKKPLANASHIVYSLIDTWLITHAHLDHVAGFVINTAGLPGTRPKKLAGLPNTIAALKTHVFNNVIWPNLTDENDGAGLVTYMRLVEGGSPALGEGESKGYLEVSDGLAVKVWGVSHGHCIERHSHRGSGSTASVYGRQGSFDLTSHGPSISSIGMGSSMFSPSLRSATHHSTHSAHSATAGNNPVLTTFLQQQQQQQQQHRDLSASQSGLAASAMSTGRAGSVSGAGTPFGESVCVYDSSATFIRDITTGREILVFGDVEPDSISLSPRNRIVWAEAAPKIVSGKLAAIFIECSYDDSQSVDRLYGHLTPRFVDEEMRALVSEVSAVRLELDRAHALAASDAMERGNSSDTRSIADKKRKRHGSDGVGAMLTRRKTSEQVPVLPTSHPSRQLLSRLNTEESISPKTAKMSFIDSLSEIASNTTDSPHLATPTAKSALDNVDLSTNLLKVPPYVEALSAASPGGTDSPHLATPTAKLSLASFPATPVSGAGDDGDETVEDVADATGVDLPLQGLKVVIIHVKDKLHDGPTVAEIVLEQLRAHEAESRTGCEYIVSYSGLSLYL